MEDTGDTVHVGLEVLWSRASKTVFHEGSDFELDALANRKPMKGVSAERRDMGELCNVTASIAAALRTA